MKATNKVLAMTVLVLGTQAAQAHITEDATHVHEGSQMRSTIQSMSPTDRLSFRDTMQTNLEGMSVEDRQAFKDTMRANQGMGEGQGGQHKYGEGMGQGTGEQHRYGGSSQGTGQGNQFMHGGSQGGGYGRGYGKR